MSAEAPRDEFGFVAVEEEERIFAEKAAKYTFFPTAFVRRVVATLTAASLGEFHTGPSSQGESTALQVPRAVEPFDGTKDNICVYLSALSSCLFTASGARIDRTGSSRGALVLAVAHKLSRHFGRTVVLDKKTVDTVLALMRRHEAKERRLGTKSAQEDDAASSATAEN